MWRRLVVIGAAIALTVGIWFVTVQVGRESEVLPLERAGGVATVEANVRADELVAVADELPNIEVSNARETVESASETTDASLATDIKDISGPTCRIFGRIQDDTEKPIEGAQVELQTVGEPWAAGVSQGKFETTSGADGKFELLTPLPTSSWISLMVRPSSFHMMSDRDFGLAGGRNEDPLIEGDNDLGNFTLMSTGTIAGFVRSADGRPFEKVRVRLDDSFPGGYELGDFADATGRYEIGHVPAGTYNIEGLANGYLSSGLKQIQVRAGVVNDGHDFVLEPAPFISGRVVGTDGEPIANVKLWGWPLSSGQGAGARTDERGEFVVSLPQAESYCFSAEKKGYVTFGGMIGREGVIYDPGTTGITIEMTREMQTTFLVVDAASGLPIERYGLAVELRPSKGSWTTSNREPVPLANHPSGEFSTFADPARHGLRIQAVGFAPQRLHVAHDAEQVGRQTIRMHSEGRLEGRVLFDGKPMTRASVRIERARIPREGEQRTEDDDIFNSKMRYDLDEYLGRLRLLTSDTEGKFAVGELASGTYQVEVITDDSVPFKIVEVPVVAGALKDLGDLQLTRGQRVYGSVVLAEGVSPLGIELRLDDARDSKTATVNAKGEFEILGVAPGAHTLQSEYEQGLMSRSTPLPIHVAAGQATEVQLDLRPWQMGKVQVHVHEAGQPVEGLQISVQHKNGGSQRGHDQTNRDGNLLLEAQNGEVGKFVVVSADGLVLGESQENLVVLPGREIQVEIEIATAELTVRLPEDFKLPELATLDFDILCDTDRLVSPGNRTMSTSTDPIERMINKPWKSTVVPLGRIAAGKLTIVTTVRVRELTEKGGQKIVSTQKFGGEVEARAGDKVVCDLKLLEEKQN